jgi:hypothetical protein
MMSTKRTILTVEDAPAVNTGVFLFRMTKDKDTLVNATMFILVTIQ